MSLGRIDRKDVRKKMDEVYKEAKPKEYVEKVDLVMREYRQIRNVKSDHKYYNEGIRYFILLLFNSLPVKYKTPMIRCLRFVRDTAYLISAL